MSPKKSAETIVAAGAVVVRAGYDGPEVLLVHRPRYDDWSFPKGKLDVGERPVLAACREVLEETATRIRLRNPLPDCSYEVDGVPKVVHYWQAEVAPVESTDADRFQPNAEVDAIAWLTVDAARDRLTQQHDRDLLDTLSWPPTTPLLLLRHAKAVKRSKWDGSDDDRPLDDVGRAESEAIADLLDVYGVARVHSSDWTRCVQTVQPYADRHGLPVVPEPGLTEEGFDEDPTAGISRLRGLVAETDEGHEATVLCSHRPVLPALIEAMLAGTGLNAPSHPLAPGAMLVAHLRDDRPVAVEVYRPTD